MQINTLQKPAIIGTEYLVPHISVNRFGKNRLLPILLPRHVDDEVVAGPDAAGLPHFHLDWRFLVDKDMKFLQLSFGDAVTVISAELPPVEGAYFNIKYIKKICQRDFFYPTPSNEFANQYSKCRVKNGKCPHQGFDLSVVPIFNGFKTCPMHGLNWKAS